MTIHFENGIKLILALLGPVLAVLFFHWCLALRNRNIRSRDNALSSHTPRSY